MFANCSCIVRIMTEWHFFDRLYRVWVMLLVCPPKQFVEKMRKDGYKYADNLDPETCKGMCLRINFEDCEEKNINCNVLWLREWNVSTLVHELVHLTTQVMEDHRVPISHDNTEVLAFYTEYWFNEISRTRRRMPRGRTPAQARKGE